MYLKISKPLKLNNFYKAGKTVCFTPNFCQRKYHKYLHEIELLDTILSKSPCLSLIRDPCKWLCHHFPFLLFLRWELFLYCSMEVMVRTFFIYKNALKHKRFVLVILLKQNAIDIIIIIIIITINKQIFSWCF